MPTNCAAQAPRVRVRPPRCKAANQHRVIALLQSGRTRRSARPRSRGPPDSRPRPSPTSSGTSPPPGWSSRRSAAAAEADRPDSPAAGLVAGIDFGHRHVRVAVGDLAGRDAGATREPIAPDHDHEEGLALARALLEELLADAGTHDGHRADRRARTAGSHQRRPHRDGRRHPARLGRGECARGGRGRAVGRRSTSTTMPTSERSPSIAAAPGSATPRWSSSRCPPASGPG